MTFSVRIIWRVFNGVLRNPLAIPKSFMHFQSTTNPHTMFTVSKPFLDKMSPASKCLLREMFPVYVYLLRIDFIIFI